MQSHIRVFVAIHVCGIKREKQDENKSPGSSYTKFQFRILGDYNKTLMRKFQFCVFEHLGFR